MSSINLNIRLKTSLGWALMKPETQYITTQIFYFLRFLILKKTNNDVRDIVHQQQTFKSLPQIGGNRFLRTHQNSIPFLIFEFLN